MEKFVYVIWGRIEPADGVWGHDGQTFFGECPLLYIFEEYETAKKVYLLFIKDAISALKKHFGDEFRDQLKHLSKHCFEDYTPSKETENSYQLIVSDKQDLDLSKKNDCISWRWYAYNWDESYLPSPILPCIYLEKRLVH